MEFFKRSCCFHLLRWSRILS